MGKRMTGPFLKGLFRILRIVWPVLGYLILVIVALGLAVAYIEGWPLADGIYFAFVTGLTIGYGDLTAKSTLGRLFALLIGFHGIILTGVIVATAVYSLRSVLVITHGVDPPELRDSSYGLSTDSSESRQPELYDNKE